MRPWVPGVAPNSPPLRQQCRRDFNPADSPVSGRALAAAEADSTLPASFADVREIYFRSVAKGGQIWGSYDFKDAEGHTVVMEVEIDGQVVDLGQLMRNGSGALPYAGFCQDLLAPEWVNCTAIQHDDYDALWLGDAGLSPVAWPYELPIHFLDPPAADGLVKR